MAENKDRKILHVDDDESILRFTKVALKKHGFDVLTVNDPLKAMGELIRTGCRVVVLDIEMPGMNGMELLRLIKQHDGGIQVIMLTGLVTQNTVLESMRWGAESCIFKPIDDVSCLASALDSSFEKVDRWWDALRDLKKREKPVNL